MTKKERLEAIIAYYSKGKPTVFARFLGVAPSTISSWLARDTFDSELLFAKCEMINPNWLLTGEGSMLKTNVNTTNLTQCRDSAETVPTTPTAQNEQQPANLPLTDAKLIPLVTPTAVAGFGNDTFAIQEADVKEYYIVPKFRYNRVDFMIEISGSSMYPKYNSGDVVACTILHDSSFIQWNKCHVIATREQGILCKRLMQSDTDDALRLVSDNPNYPPFDVPKSEITGIALVIGVIRLE